MRAFAVYTLARVGLFLAAYGLIWLIFGRWIGWDSVSALYTALIAMAVSSLVALTLLRPLRADFAEQVAHRADRAKAAHDARVRAEDDD